MSGSISCFVNFTVDEETGYLSSDQLENFKTQIVLVFSALCNNSEDIDIRQVLKTPLASDGKWANLKLYSYILPTHITINLMDSQCHDKLN